MTKQPNTVPAIDRRSPSADSGGHFHAVSLSGGKDSSYLLLRMIELGMSNGTLADDNEGLTSSNGLYVTDENGQIYLSKLTPATYVITEVTARTTISCPPAPRPFLSARRTRRPSAFTTIRSAP